MRCSGIACGVTWMVVSQLLFVASWAAIKFLGTRLPLFEIVFFRGLISLIIIVFLAFWKEGTLKGRDYPALFLRSLFGYAAMLLAFYAMINVDMGNASVLFNTLPIFVALLAPPILGEAFSWRKLVIIFIAFAGIAMILRPDSEILNGASIFALIAGFLGSFAMLSVRKMAKSDSALIITLYFSAFTTVCSAPFALREFVPPSISEWWWLLIIGCALTAAQVFMAHAYKFGHASTIAPFSYVSVIGSYIAGIVFFGEVPDGWSIAGAAIIILSGTAIMLTEPTTAQREELRSAKVT